MHSIVLFYPGNGFYDLLARGLPLALLSISRYLHKEYKIDIIDQRVPGWKAKLITALKDKPLCVGITSTTGRQIANGLEISKFIKEHYSLPVVWGGIHPTLIPEQTLESPYIDAVVKGEGEVSFYKLIKAIESRGSFKGIAGIYYKEEGRIKHGPQSQFLDLEELPPLPYQLINLSDYAGYSPQNFGNIFFFESGRGCPNRCAYCYNSAQIYKRHIMSAQSIVEGIKYLKQITKVDGVTFVDDNFFAEPVRTEALIKLLRDEKLKLLWNCEIDVNDLKRMSDETLRDLQACGLSWMSIGVESGSPRILKLVKKAIAIEDVIEQNLSLSKYNFLARFNFMCGFITEDNQALKESTNLVLRLLKDNRRASVQALQMAVPYPQTEYFRLAINYGLNPPQKLEGWSYFNPDEWIAYAPWCDDKKKSILNTLFITSLFLDNKIDINTTAKNSFGKLLRLFYKSYKPLAKFRFEHHFDRFLLEEKLLRHLQNLN